MIRTIRLFVLLLLTVCLHSCSQSNHGKETGDANKMFVEVKPFQTETGWGYKIYADDKLYISQNYIPGVRGKHSFATKTDAQKVGNLAVKKMDMYHQFPVITYNDLQSLHISIPTAQ